jgi:uncharacterized membrane protein YjjP (DUF1212 family)
MDYNTLLDLATDLGYHLAMSGAETFRVEESISRVLKAYDIQSEVFAIPNCLTVSIETHDGQILTRMRRIGFHSNDMDAVARYSNLSRAICANKPDPETALQWLNETQASCRKYPIYLELLGHFLGAFGFSMVFGGNLLDALFGGICGLIIGVISLFMGKFKVNQFFTIIAASFAMAIAAYAAAAMGIPINPDMVNIGALMLLVPGLLFTNAMRDIIFGDTNSGTNRIVQVMLIAVAIALGTAAAWNVAASIWAPPVSIPVENVGLIYGSIACLIGCFGFSIVFNIHGVSSLFCTIGGIITWIAYAIALNLGSGILIAMLIGTIVAAAYSETMARVRKTPALSYLAVGIFPLLPGAGIYYTMNYAVQGNMDLFISKGMHTAAEAGVMAVAILLVSTIVRLILHLRSKRISKRVC